MAVAIIGAGPYGLSIAAHLRSRKVPFRIFGTPLDTWRHHVPAGMTLKSDPFASNLSAPDGRGTLAEYCAAHAVPYDATHIPVTLDVFNTYAMDFQERFVPELEDKQVVRLDRKGDGFLIELDDGEVLESDLVVSAVGISYFARVPEELAHLSGDLFSHSSAHHDLDEFAGRDVTVIGGGSSAVDLATLLSEAGATTSLIARRPGLRFSSHGCPDERTRWERLRRPSSGMGPGLRSWLLQKFPHLFRFVPGRYRLEIVRRHLGPQTAWIMKERFDAGVNVSLGEHIESATAEDGKVRLVLRTATGQKRETITDHVVAATGYYPNVSAVDFLTEDLKGAIETHAGMAMLSGNFESSVAGLYFVGPAAANSFGPLMRFMVGSEYVAPRITRHLARVARRSESGRTSARP
jgi:cation diffusion facilitator CzcD-associated flavoprotein CzcO